MSLRQYTNNANTILAAGIASNATSMSVQAGGGALFPALSGSQYCLLTLNKAGNTAVMEIVKATARSTDTFTIVRAQENTTGLTWNSGDSVSLLFTAGDAMGFVQFDDLSPYVTYPQIQQESNAGVTPNSVLYPPGDVRRYGAVMDGTTDDTTAWSHLALVMAQGVDGYAPPLPTFINTQVVLVAPAYVKVTLNGYGCTVYTSHISGIYGFAVTGGFMGGLLIQGFTFSLLISPSNSAGNTVMKGGVCLFGSWNCIVQDCIMRVADATASYVGAALVAILPGNATANFSLGSDFTNDAYGAFWNKVLRCHTRQNSGNATYYAAFSVYLLGACNATIIKDCNFSSTNYGVAIYNSTTGGSTGSMSNAVLIEGNAFEGGVNGLLVNGQNFDGTGTGARIEGLRIINNRCEGLTSGSWFFYALLHDSNTPTQIEGNYYVSNALPVVSQQNSVFVTINIWEPSITPSGSVTLTMTGSPVSGSTSATMTVVWPYASGDYQLAFAGIADTPVGTMTYNSSAVTWNTALSGNTSGTSLGVMYGLMTSMQGQGPYNLSSTAGDAINAGSRTGYGISLYTRGGARTFKVINRVGGGAALIGSSATQGLTISGTSTPANNLRGSGSTSGASTAQVNFTINEPDTSYFIYVQVTSGGGGITGIAKSTNHFIITWTGNESNTFDWFLLR